MDEPELIKLNEEYEPERLVRAVLPLKNNRMAVGLQEGIGLIDRNKK